MSNIITTEQSIYKKIYIIREHRVMLDKDLAELYEVETRILNQAVKRNIERFPEDFMFELTREEIMRISQIVISLKFSKTVYAFTEHGISMLSSVLNSKRAIQVNIQIVRTFIKLRQMLLNYADLKRKIENMESKYDSKFTTVFKVLKKILTAPKEPPKKPIGFTVKS